MNFAQHDIRLSFMQAFREAYLTYFNEELLEGALVIPLLVVAPGQIDTRIVACEPVVRQTDVISGHGPQRIKDAVKAIFTQIILQRPKEEGFVPVFRSLPTMECGGLNMSTATWDVALWCDMTWVPPDSDFSGLERAWKN